MYANIIYYCDNEFNIIAKSLDSGKVLWRTNLTLEDSENFIHWRNIFVGNNIFVTTGLEIFTRLIKKKLPGLKDFYAISRPPLVYKIKCL